MAKNALQEAIKEGIWKSRRQTESVSQIHLKKRKILRKPLPEKKYQQKFPKIQQRSLRSIIIRKLKVWQNCKWKNCRGKGMTVAWLGII